MYLVSQSVDDQSILVYFHPLSSLSLFLFKDICTCNLKCISFQACQLKPGCEVYKETLDFFQARADLLDNKQQGLSYASVSRPKPSCGKAEQKSYSVEWNVKKARGKVPEVSTCYYSHADEQATIDNPWASYVSRSHRKRSTPSSPIDGLTEIDLPQMSEDMWYSSGSQSLKEDYDRQDRDEVDSFFSSSLNTPISSQEALNEDSSVCDHKQENHSDDTVDAFVNQREECPEEFYEDSGNYEEDVDSRFLDELCAARETFLDDWAKYYDVLNRDLKEESPCSESGVLNQGVSTPLEYSDSFDDAKSIKDKKKINHSGKEKSNSEKPESKISCDVCANCGQPKEGRTQPCNTPKNRIHFVNGTCISSANSPISNCTCNRKHSVKGVFKGKSGKTPLSTSQQEFYQNLQNYFGSGAVKSVKTDSKVKKESSSGGMDANCATNLNSSSLSNEPSKVKSGQNVAESNECNTKDSKHSDDFASKEQLTDGVEGLRSSFSEDGVMKDKTSFDEGRFHQESFSEGRKVGDNVDNNTKATVNTEHVKSSKERTDSHWRSRFKAGVKSKVSHRAKSIDPAETRKPSNAHVKERSRLKPRTERTVHAEFDLSKLTSGLYCTGILFNFLSITPHYLSSFCLTFPFFSFPLFLILSFPTILFYFFPHTLPSWSLSFLFFLSLSLSLSCLTLFILPSSHSSFLTICPTSFLSPSAIPALPPSILCSFFSIPILFPSITLPSVLLSFPCYIILSSLSSLFLMCNLPYFDLSMLS